MNFKPYIGKFIRPTDNQDINDTLQPMWNNDNLDENTRALVYACAILSDKVTTLQNAVMNLGGDLTKASEWTRTANQERMENNEGNKEGNKEGDVIIG